VNSSPAVEPSRLIALDQFRGYTVLGMFFVNFIGGYIAIPAIFKHHHTYCSYADTIMPQFLFAAGFAARLTWVRKPSSLRVFRRTFGLLLISLVIYQLDGRYEKWQQIQDLGWDGFFSTAFKRNLFQTLAHIALTGLWVWPVLGASIPIRIFWLILSAVGFHVMSEEWYYKWVLTPPVGIDGGPLAFFSWTIAYIAGTIAHDWLMDPNRTRQQQISLLVWSGLVVALIGYGLSCINRMTPPNSMEEWTDIFNEPPFVPPTKPINIWTMAQRPGSVSYITFATGFSLLVLALFVWLCEVKGFRWGYLDLLGQNALAGYIIHGLVEEPIKPFLPKDSPGWYVLTMFAVYLLIITLFLRYMAKHKLYLRM
jgi:predicted acyltransferase